MPEDPRQEYLDYYKDDRPTLLKSAAGLIGSLAAWGIGLAAAHAVLRRGKTGLLKSISRSTGLPTASQVATENLAKYKTTGGSMSHFYAKLGWPGGQFIKSLRHAAVDEPITKSYFQYAKKVSVYERNQILRGKRILSTVSGESRTLTKIERRTVMEGIGARYTREMATIAPLFYGAEQALGRPDQGAHDRAAVRHPAWYNVPGHMVNFARWLPGFVAFDITARGAFKGIPYAYHAAMTKGTSNQSLRTLNEALSAAQQYQAKTASKNPIVQAKASWAAFQDFVGTRRTGGKRPPFFSREGGRPPVGEWIDESLKFYSKKRSEYAQKYARDLQSVADSPVEYVMGRTLVNFLDPPEGLHRNFHSIFSIMRRTGNLGPDLRRQLSNQLFTRPEGSKPLLARLGGLTPLGLRHLKETGLDDMYESVYLRWNDAVRKAGIRTQEAARKAGTRTRKVTPAGPAVVQPTYGRVKGRGAAVKHGRAKRRSLQKQIAGKARQDAAENRDYEALFRAGEPSAAKRTHELDDILLSPDLYFDPKRKEIVDLTGVRGYNVIGRSLNALQRRLSIFDRFPMVDIFPIRAFVGYDMPDFVVTGKSLIPDAARANLPPAGDNTKMKVVSGKTHPLLFLRDPGKRTYTMYRRSAIASPRGEEYRKAATNLFGVSRFASEKMTRVAEQMEKIYPSRISQFDRANAGKLRTFLFEKLNMGGGPLTKDSPSLLTIVREHFSGNNRAWKILGDGYGFRSKFTEARVREFAESADSATRLTQLNQVYMQARREAFRTVLNKDPIWEQIIHRLNPKLEGKLKDLKGNSRVYKIEELMMNKPEKDGTLPILDVLRNLYESGPGGSPILADTANRRTVHDFIKHGINYRAVGEPVDMSARRTFTEYHLQQELLGRTTAIGARGLSVEDKVKNIQSAMKDVIDDVLGVGELLNKGLITRRDAATVEMAMQGIAWEGTLRKMSPDPKRTSEAITSLFGSEKGWASLTPPEQNNARFILKFLESMQKDVSGKEPPIGFSGLWDDYRTALGKWKTIEASYTGEAAAGLTQSTLQDNPYVWFHNDAATWGRFFFHHGTETFGRVLDFVGLGWDRGQYNKLFGSNQGVLNLWGRRLAMAGGVAAIYQGVDTFVDANPMFKATGLDEGLTTAIADQAVRARMIASYIYDTTGVTEAMKYMEGLMPKSTKTLPGAAAGFAMGGIPGMIAGGIINAAIQPTLEGGPLSSLAVVPPLAPFVADLTKSYEELKDIYSGKEWIPIRKGRGWPLGNQPIEGGRITQYRPNWYHLLKSQPLASPVLYGSKIEQFLFKDLPLLDFSFGDLIDPRYLERKHKRDRPYPVPDVPFSEIPVLGPTIGNVLGRLYLALHPLGDLEPASKEAAVQELQFDSEFATDQTGFAPSYAGALGTQFTGTGIKGTQGRYPPVQSPYSVHQLLAEQVYKGVIEPMGLQGWATSALLWRGDEPYTDEPVMASASEMDSFARRYWDMQLGDPLLLSEAARRLVPRPRTSFEKVNPLENTMPDWMPEEFRVGDPFCLHPDAVVETEEGLVKANQVEAGMLTRTIHSRYFPISRVKERHVEEKIYTIHLGGMSHPTPVTGEHPFRIVLKEDYGYPHYWVKAKDIRVGDKVVYPLLTAPTEPYLRIRTHRRGKNDVINIPMSSYLMLLLAKITKYGQWVRGRFEFKRQTPQKDIEEVRELIRIVLGSNTTSKHWVIPELQRIVEQHKVPSQMYNIPPQLLAAYLSGFVHTLDIENRTITFSFDGDESRAYKVWSVLLNNYVITRLNGDKLTCPNWVQPRSGRHLNNSVIWKAITGRNEKEYYPKPPDYVTYYERTDTKTRVAEIKVVGITTKDYQGPVYGYQVDTDDTFCSAGCLVHNTRIPMGEVLLPGPGFEAVADVKTTFPVDVERLSTNTYTQALNMIGLGDEFADEIEEEPTYKTEGTKIRRLVQASLTREGVLSKVEALVYDPYNQISGHIDGIIGGGQEGGVPMDIRVLNAAGFQHLTSPKQKHILKLNAYMGLLDSKRGTIMYVNEENPGQTQTYDIPFNPKLWQQTVDQTEEARNMAAQWAAQGYGNRMGGYSYLDRLQVLTNAAPFSKEFREIDQIVTEQAQLGLLDPDEEKQLEKIGRWHKSISRRYDLYPHRFSIDQIIEPDHQLRQYNTNELIKASAEYSLGERLLGSVWEKFTSLRSPIHSKLIGAYSPEEMYERSVLYGSSFYDWTKPIDTIIEPMTRGLKSVTGPIQGGMSFGMGGMLVGGMPGAVLGGFVGGVYGTLHGVYRMLSGTTYIPNNFKKQAAVSQYFDRLRYDQARYMWQATHEPAYLNEMTSTAVGWMANPYLPGGVLQEQQEKQQRHAEVTRSRLFNPSLSSSIGIETAALSDLFERGRTFAEISRGASRPIDFDLSPDLGFGSPWKGMDQQSSLDYSPLNMGSALAAAPYWDRPFFTAFLDTPKEKRDKVLQMVDEDFANMLRTAWQHGDVDLEEQNDYFDTHHRPAPEHPINLPDTKIEHWEQKTIEQYGLQAHDFGLGWRSQIREMNASPFKIDPLNVNATNHPLRKTNDFSLADVKVAAQAALGALPLNTNRVSAGVALGTADKIVLNITVTRDAVPEIVRLYKEKQARAPRN